MIKAIIFDYGGVLSTDPAIRSFGYKLASKYGVDAQEFADRIIENWLPARTNEVPSVMFWRNLAKYLNTDEKSLRSEVIEFYKFRQELYELVKGLKHRYKLGMLSNFIEDWMEELIERHHFDQVFDIIVTSFGSRLAKPDPAIYKKIVDKLGVHSEECIYIDDLESNLHPARELGMKTILFKDIASLKQDLAAFSIKL